jgi:hypothetical protein
MSAPFNWKIRLQLMKPGTWVPLIWGVACGAAASGNFHAVWNIFGDAPTTDSWGVVGTDTIKAIGAMMLSGPILCGFTQTINDWYDRDLDAINEPYRPIPSGAISEGEVYFQIYALLLSGIALSIGLDVWAMHEWPVIGLVASIGIILAYTYSVRRHRQTRRARANASPTALPPAALPLRARDTHRRPLSSSRPTAGRARSRSARRTLRSHGGAATPCSTRPRSRPKRSSSQSSIRSPASGSQSSTTSSRSRAIPRWA